MCGDDRGWEGGVNTSSRRFSAMKEVLRDYWPDGVERRGHVPGMDCPCEPYEAECETCWRRNRREERVGVVIRVVITHRQIAPPPMRVSNVRLPDFAGEGLPAGSPDLVTQMNRVRSWAPGAVSWGTAS